MSDPGRKSFHTELSESLTLSIFKSKATKLAERASDAADTTAREGQPDGSKSVPQSAVDKLGRVKDRVFHWSSHRATRKKTHCFRNNVQESIPWATENRQSSFEMK